MILFLINFKLYKKGNPKHVVFLSSFILKEKDGKENEIIKLDNCLIHTLANWHLLIKINFHLFKIYYWTLL